jgi:hypothetical protein
VKRKRAVYLSFVILGLAIPSSSRLMAQTAPVPTATAVPSADTTTPRRSASAPGVSPILAYTVPTEEQKLQLLAYNVFGPVAIAEASVTGGIQQATKSPPEWGSSWNGYGKRVASAFGVELVTTAANYGIAEVLREDAAYYACECRGFLPRVRHAVISTFTARRGADGHTVFAIGGLVSPYAGSMTALAWYPHRYGLKDGFRMGNYNLAGQAAGNLLLEFIYGGPHALFGRLRHSKTPDQNAEVRKP